MRSHRKKNKSVLQTNTRIKSISQKLRSENNLAFAVRISRSALLDSRNSAHQCNLARERPKEECKQEKKCALSSHLGATLTCNCVIAKNNCCETVLLLFFVSKNTLALYSATNTLKCRIIEESAKSC